MTPNELLTLVGLAWPRLIIYPGGLALFALIWFVARTKNQELRTGSQFLVLGSRFLDISSLALAWLGLALLPLPAATPMSRTTDVVVVLALLEWPRVVAIAAELRTRDTALQQAGMRRLAAALNSYPTLILATLALVQPAGSFDIAALARPPGEAATQGLQALHWLGAGAWVLALAPLIGVGPFRASVPESLAQPRRAFWQHVTNVPASHQSAKIRRGPIESLAAWVPGGAHSLLEVALAIRGCALAALAALPWLAPSGALQEQGSYGIRALLAIALAPITLGFVLWLYDRTTALQPARRWARAYLILDAVLLLALLLAAYQALERR